MAASQSLDDLTRKHGIKIITAERCSVEDCTIAVAEVVGYSSILSAARMNSAVVIFLNSVEKVNDVVVKGIVVNSAFTPVMPLVQPAKRITLSNVPPFIRDEMIERELMRHGKVVSKIRKIALGSKLPQLKHVVSFRRQTYMVLKNENEELSLAMKFKVDNYDYVIYATSESMKCFGCGQEGHIIRACPEKVDSVMPLNENQINLGRNEEQRQSETGERSSADTENGVGNINDVEKENLEEVVNEAIKANMKEFEATDSLVVIGGEEDLEMVENESVFKTPAIKRKLQKKGCGKRGRKEIGGEVSGKDVENSEIQMESDNVDESQSAPESGSDSSGSVSSASKKRFARSDYTIDRIRKFLQTTKGMKGVRVEDYFPDRELFVNSAKMSMKEKGASCLTNQEIYRLKKFVQKIKMNILNDEFETD